MPSLFGRVRVLYPSARTGRRSRTLSRGVERQAGYLWIEGLEVRSLLAGNVLASFSNGTLTLTGDNAANTVAVTVSDGDVVVRGLDGTTVNGGATDFVAVADSSSITGALNISMADGNDTVAVGAVTIGTDLSFDGGAGDDALGLKGTTIRGDLTSSDESGRNGFSITDSSIEGSAEIERAETVGLKNTTVGDNLKVGEAEPSQGLFRGLFGLLGSFDRWGILNRLQSHGIAARLEQAKSTLDGYFERAGASNPLSRLFDGLLGGLDPSVPEGPPSSVVLDTTTVGGNLKVSLPDQGGNVVMKDSTVEGRHIIRGGNASDFVNLNNTTLKGYSNTSLGRGNDLLLTEGTTKFEGIAVALGGSGEDALQTSSQTTFARSLRKYGFESMTVDATTAASRRTAAETAVNGLATTMAGLLSSPAPTVASSATLAAAENDETPESSVIADTISESAAGQSDDEPTLLDTERLAGDTVFSEVSDVLSVL